MGSIAQLLSELEADGRLEAAGTFTLDRAKAREKMRQFQLPDPHRYVLLLVSTAAEVSATQIAFRIDTDDMEASFDGEAFTRHDFDELYVSMFGARADAKVRARQDLALALNAAMALNPRWIKVCSRGTDGSGVMITMRPNAEDVVEDLEPGPQTNAGTHIHVKDRFGPGLFMKFVDSVRGKLVEELLIKEQCQHATWPILLAGDRVAQGMRLHDCWGIIEEQAGRSRLVAGIERAGAPARMVVLVHGVTLATHVLADAPRGLVVMVDGPELRRDVSQADVVRDASYDALLERAVALGERALLAFVQELGPKIEGVAYVPDPDPEASQDDDEDDGKGAWRSGEADDLIVDPMATSGAASTTALVRVQEPEVPAWVAPMMLAALEVAARGVAAGQADSPLLAALKGVRLWRTVAGELVDTRAVAAVKSRVAFTQHLVRHFDAARHGSIVYAPTRAARAALRRVFGKRAVDRTRTLVREARYARNRAQWQARPRPPKLGYGMIIARAPIRSTDLDVAGEVGLRDGGTTEANLVVIIDGCVLFEAHPAGSIPGLSIVVEAPLQPNAAYQGVRRTPAMGHVVAAILCAITEMMTQLDASRPDRQALLFAYLWRLENGELARGLFEAFGVKPRSVDKRIAQADGDGARPVWAPDWRLSGPDPHPIAQMPLFEQLGRRPTATLVDVARALGEHGRIAVVERQTQHLEPPEPVLVVGQTRLAMLESFFGGGAVVDVRSEVVAWRFRAEHENKLVLPRQLAHPLRIGPFVIDSGGGTVTVGVRLPDPNGPDDHASAHIDVRIASRHLVCVRAACSVPGIVAIVDDDRLAVNDHYDDLASDAAREDVVATVMRAAAQMLRAHLEATSAPGAADPWAVTALLGAAIPGDTWHRALRMLIDERGPDKGEAAYRALLDLRLRFRGADVTRHLKARLKQGNIGVAALGRALAGAHKAQDRQRPIPTALLRCGAAEQLGLLRSLAVFARVDGGRASLDDLWARYDETDSVWWLAAGDSEQAPMDTGPEMIVRLSEDARGVVGALFGARTLVEATAYLQELARLRRFVETEPLASLELESSVALVQVPIDGDGVQGTVGLGRQVPGDEAGRVLRCWQRRSLGWIVVAMATPLVAIVSSDSSNRESEALNAKDKATLGALCMGYEVVLIERLLELQPHADARAAAIGRGWIRWFLAHRWKELRARHGSVARRLADAPAFEILNGPPVSWKSLRAARAEHGRTRAVTGDPTGRIVCDEFVLDLRNPATREVVGHLLGEIESHETLRVREQQRAQQMASAPPMPTVPPGAWVDVLLAQGGLQGRLWLTPFTIAGEGIALGSEGRRLAWLNTWDLDGETGFLPCGGAVEGPGVRVDEQTLTARLNDDAVYAVRRASERLYARLAELFAQARLQSRAGDAGGAMAGPAVRSRLAAAARQLAHERRHSGQRKGVRGALQVRLAKLPLFGLASGRSVSIDDAREAQPLELAHLGLWDAAELESAALDRLSGVRDSDPEPPEPEPPEPEPTLPPTPTPREQWLEAIRNELRLVRKRNRALLTDAHLDAVAFADLDGVSLIGSQGLASIDSQHPVVARLLATPGDPDPVLVSFVASAVYTALNLRLREVTDADEAAFIEAHAEHVATAVR